MRRLWMLGAAALLAGCQMAPVGPHSGATAPRQTQLGGFAFAAPAGYCVDPSASRPTSGFALIGTCARLAGSGTVPVTDAVGTVQVGKAGSALVKGAEPALAAVFSRVQGRALLSGQNNAASVSNVQVFPEAGLVLIRFDDAAPALRGQGPVWRAFFDHRSKVVTVSLRGQSAGGLDLNAARTLARQIGAGLG